MQILLLTVAAAAVSGCASTMREAAPGVNYIPDASYYLMMAEIALQEKQYRTVAKEYLNAAQQSSDSEIASRSTQFAFEYGFDSYALSSAQRWLALEPDNPAAHEYAARLYLRRHQIDRALDHWRQSLGPGDEHSDEQYLALGASLAEEDNAAGATRVLIQLSIEAPDSDGLRLALAQAALRSGAYDLALHSARKVAQSDPESLPPQFVIAQALLSSGAEAEAMQHMQGLIERSPNLLVELEYVRMLSASDRVANANEELRRIAQKYGGHAEIARMHALLSLISGDLDSAERDFSQLLANSSSVYESYFYLGQIASLRQNYSEAIKFFGRISGGERLVPAQIGISQAYFQLGEPQTALTQLETFIENYPHHAFDIVMTQTSLLHSMGRDEEALEIYDDALLYKPDSIDLLLARATLLDQMNRVDAALEAMEYAVALAPMNANALNTLGYTLTNKTDRHAEAYRHIRIALELEPYSPAVIDSMGWVLYRQGRLEEARSYLEQAYSMLDDPELVAHLGEVWWVTGEQDRARELWDISLKSNPDSKPLLDVRTKYLP
ncbi:MAG: tetratricopeptide repeat protein [Gammaproteobacteria bacterium]|nr:tetratricopeptide repeat protein [Gammaproteobacteria bacterium]